MDYTRGKRGGFGTLMTIAFRNIGRNIRRTIFCVVAVAFAVFFSIFMQSWIAGMTDNIASLVQVFDVGHVNAVSSDYEAEKEYYPVQYPVGEGRSRSALTGEIKAIPGVKAVFPRISAYATLQESTLKHAILWGLEIEEEMKVNHFNLSERSNGLKEGRYPREGSNECAIGLAMAHKVGFKIGDRIPLKTVSAQFSDKMWSPEIVGFFKFDYLKYDEDVIVVPFDRLQRLLVLGDGTQQLFIFAQDNTKSKAIAKEVQKLLGGGNVVREWQDNYWVAIMQQTQAIYVVVYLVFMIVASFLIVNTVVMIIHERIKEIGMMGSLGMTRREIVEVFFFEALFLSIIGSLTGIFVGGVLTAILQFFPMDFGSIYGSTFKEFPLSGTLFIQFSVKALVQGFILGVVIASVCTLIPSLKSAFVEPVEALR
ncbi:MAG: ABC transporter permease [Treponema sp.]|jgi:putative ABC transport system permease protein|nr:ABC transporter permease [Treponema sp.]